MAAKLTDFFRCPDPSCVTFTRSASEALSGAVRSVMRYGDQAVTTVMEHSAVLSPLIHMTGEAAGLYQDYYFRTRSGSRPVTGFTAGGTLPDGRLDIEEMCRAIRRKRPRLVITGGGSTVTGDRFELAEIVSAAHQSGASVICDAAYTAGLFPIDMEKDGIDILCFSGHKNLYGPDGIGGIIFRKTLSPEITERLMKASVSFDGEEGIGPDASVMKGLEAAVDYLKLTGENHIRAHALALARRFYEGIRDIPDIVIKGCYEDYDRFPIVSFEPRRMSAERFAARLLTEWNIEAGTAREPQILASAGQEKPSALVRFSFPFSRTEEEADMAAEAVRSLCTEGPVKS